MSDLRPEAIASLLRYWNGFIEHCGIITTTGYVIEVPNVATRGIAEFAMTTDDVYQVAKPIDIAGVWHTHPSNSDRPSQMDTYGWPKGYRYFIVTQHAVTEWAIDEHRETRRVSQVGQTMAGRLPSIAGQD